MVVVGFQLGGWEHADLAVEALVVEPVDVLQRDSSRSSKAASGRGGTNAHHPIADLVW
jgi:hypothetical protein